MTIDQINCHRRALFSVNIIDGWLAPRGVTATLIRDEEAEIKYRPLRKEEGDCTA
jgi:hypothetical protein